MKDGAFQARFSRLNTGHVVAVPLLLLLGNDGLLGWGLAALIETRRILPDQL